MRDALNQTGREIYFSLCGWFSWYAPVGCKKKKTKKKLNKTKQNKTKQTKQNKTKKLNTQTNMNKHEQKL